MPPIPLFVVRFSIDTTGEAVCLWADATEEKATDWAKSTRFR